MELWESCDANTPKLSLPIIQSQILSSEPMPNAGGTANFQQEPVGNGNRLLIEFNLQMSMAGGEAAVVYFHCDKMITGLRQSHQVLKLILELGNTSPYLLKKVEENERVS